MTAAAVIVGLTLVQTAGAAPAAAHEDPARTTFGGVRMEADLVEPSALAPGAVAKRIIVFTAPDSAVPAWPDTLAGGTAEAAGRVQVERGLADGGRIRWRLAYPFTAWIPGAARTGTGRITVGAGSHLELSDVNVIVVDPRSAGDSAAPPPAAVYPPAPLLPTLLSGGLFLTLAGIAVQRRRGRVAGSPPPSQPAAPDAARLRTDLCRVREAARKDEPGAARALGDVARWIPTLAGAGIGPADTSGEVVAAAQRVLPPASLDLVAQALYDGDAARYGGVPIQAERTLALADSLLQVLDA